MRRTLHIVPAPFAPVPHVATRRLRMGAVDASARRAGVAPAELDRAGDAVAAPLEGGAMPRP
jgi:hypothetical protein